MARLGGAPGRDPAGSAGLPPRAWSDAAENTLGGPAGPTRSQGPSRAGDRVGLSPLRPHRPDRLIKRGRRGRRSPGHGFEPRFCQYRRRCWLCRRRPQRLGSKQEARLKSSWLREAEPDFKRRWPREESNLRARIRSPSLYPLSYGAVRSSVALAEAKLSGPQRRGGGLCPPPPPPLYEAAIPTKVMRRRRDFRR